MKKTLLLLSFIFLGISILGQTVFAANVVLSILPATTTKTVGTTINASVQIDPQENKICVVKGTLNFENLTCQGITVATGLIPQVVPTCSNPNFTIGIPKCTTDAQNILSISAKGGVVGQGKIALSGVSVIGAGTAVAFNSADGIYSITAVPKTEVKTVPPTQTTEPAEPTVIKEEPETTEPEAIETVIPVEASTASLATRMGDFISSPIVLIILVIILVLIGSWLVEKFLLKNRNKQ